MKFPLYTIGYAGLGLAAAPYFLTKGLVSGKYLWNLSERFGWVEPALIPKSGPRVLVHALSLGETLSVMGLVDSLTARGYEVVLSTTTRSGHQAAVEKTPPGVRALQFPFDWPPAVRRFQAAVQPDIFVLVETDIWPNFLVSLYQKGIPAILVNARVSARSLPRLRLVKGWWAGVLNLFTHIGVQTDLDQQRMVALGVAPEKITVTGNLKFDRPAPETGPEVRRLLLLESGLPEGFWLVGGSTHQGEEEALLDIFRKLRPGFREFKLLLAPRDETRFETVWRLIEKTGLKAARRSGGQPGADLEVFLLDTQGELDRFYEAADLVFIGKSLLGPGERGGHNPLEPAARGKPVLFGPRMENFLEISRIMVAGGGARQVAGPEELEAVIVDLLADANLRSSLGRSASALVDAHRGALKRNIDLIAGLPGITGQTDR